MWHTTHVLRMCSRCNDWSRLTYQLLLHLLMHSNTTRHASVHSAGSPPPAVTALSRQKAGRHIDMEAGCTQISSTTYFTLSVRTPPTPSLLTWITPRPPASQLTAPTAYDPAYSWHSSTASSCRTLTLSMPKPDRQPGGSLSPAATDQPTTSFQRQLAH